MLDLLEDFLGMRDITYSRFDGSTPRPRRTLDIKLVSDNLHISGYPFDEISRHSFSKKYPVRYFISLAKQLLTFSTVAYQVMLISTKAGGLGGHSFRYQYNVDSQVDRYQPNQGVNRDHVRLRLESPGHYPRLLWRYDLLIRISSQNDLQAIARAHRIGQKNTVKVRQACEALILTPFLT